ncbi:MAG: DUF1499 domain-containing protein [Hyphomicrobiaceae bacterium]|nr:MAG: DUF1499 domain-containing protein [Hyphomicrobiaceae bacterium]
MIEFDLAIVQNAEHHPGLAARRVCAEKRIGNLARRMAVSVTYAHRLSQQRSAATWSLRLSLFAAQVVLLGVLLHRFLGLPTPVMINMLVAAMAISVLALVLGPFALWRIWSRGGRGVRAASTGALLAIGLVSWPLALAPTYFQLPRINDITTDTQSPPLFQAVAKWRDQGANPLAYPSEAFAALQREHYPDLKPLVVSRPVTEAFELVREIIRRRGWMIVALRPPGQGRDGAGEIEAIEQTTVIGFHDDIVIRLKPEHEKTRIDVRSASRHGITDLGRNAERIRSVLREFYARIDLGVALEKDDELDRRKRIRRRRPAAVDRTQVLQSVPAPTQQDAQRVPGRRLVPRQQDENRARDRRRQ